jgi:hypothetical protein
MHKGKSKSMQRGAAVRDRTSMSKEDFYSGTKIELTEAEVKHFHFGTNDVASFVGQIEPTIRHYANNGFRKPRDVSRLLNKEHKRTACGEAWTPRLAWFLLKLMFGSNVKPKPQLAQKVECASAPKKTRILAPFTERSENTSLAAAEFSEKRLTSDEIARRLSSFARVVRKS